MTEARDRGVRQFSRYALRHYAKGGEGLNFESVIAQIRHERSALKLKLLLWSCALEAANEFGRCPAIGGIERGKGLPTAVRRGDGPPQCGRQDEDIGMEGV